MTIATHCLPNDVLGTDEVPVPNISANTVLTLTPVGGVGLGNIRGVVVICHGLDQTTQTIPHPLVDAPGGFLPNLFRTLANNLVLDGWLCIQPIYQEDNHRVSPVYGIFTDMQNDATFGARYLASALHWWDHVVIYIHKTYGEWPIVPFGFSEGGWHALTMAANRTSDIVAYGAHCPWTIGSTLSTTFTPGFNFGSLNTTGFDTTTTQVNDVDLPGVIGYGTNDTAVGWDLAGTGGTPISNTDAIITNAVAAGQNVTRHATTDAHAISSSDATFYPAWFASTVDPLCPRQF